MKAVLEILGDDLALRVDGASARLRLTDARRTMIEDWRTDYAAAVGRCDFGAFAAIGADLFAWLDEEGLARRWAESSGGALRRPNKRSS